MRNLAIGLVAVLLAGCSSMGSGMMGTSGNVDTSAGVANADNSVPFSQQGVNDPRTGALTLYHGG